MTTKLRRQETSFSPEKSTKRSHRANATTTRCGSVRNAERVRRLGYRRRADRNVEEPEAEQQVDEEAPRQAAPDVEAEPEKQREE
ncbi:unnamed protein product [Lasius platythorax]